MILATLVLSFLPQVAADSEPLPPCVQAFFDGAQQKQADALTGLLAPGGQVGELETLYQLLLEVPFRYECIEQGLQNQDRALVCMKVRSQLDQEGSAFWFWLVGSDQNAKLFGVVGDDRYSREWLYETPKEGLSSSPEAAAKSLFLAMQEGNAKAAERAASDLAWRKQGGDLESLFQTARTSGLGFVTEQPVVRGARSVVGFGFEFNGQRQGTAHLYVEKRGSGWIATGFDDSAEHAEAFLRGDKAGTVWPKSPFEAYEGFVAALSARQTVRLAALSQPGYAGSEAFGEAWLPQTLQRLKPVPVSSSVRFQEGRGVGRIDYAPKGGKPTRSVYCLLAATPEGWRVVGHAASEAEVESHLSGQPPKPDRNE
ncbi:MAG: hypothetical protein H6827_06915 [Planctomycetes bacterium]|nr:hypothetical protein [Planctomycetota bacterium]HPF12890.1 hypothetical protein [Planctomycetota bacterium]